MSALASASLTPPSGSPRNAPAAGLRAVPPTLAPHPTPAALRGARPLDVDALPAGNKVGFYEIENRLGAGGFGTVYRVVRDGRRFALKLSRTRLADLEPKDREHLEARLDREVVALKMLRHPNIVRVHAFERWPDLETGHPYLVMDLVEGDRLSTWLRERQPSLPAICQLFHRLALALDAMHRMELVHRDLKAENILVRPDGEPVIVDFGIARARTSLTVTGEHVMVGTYCYFSPEYCAFFGSDAWRRGVRFVHRPAADLHALGLMFYEALTGEPAYGRRNRLEMLRALATERPRPPRALNPEVSEPLEAIVLRLLEKAPEARFPDGAALAAALAALQSSAGEQPSPLGQATPATRADRPATPSLPSVPVELHTSDLMSADAGAAVQAAAAPVSPAPQPVHAEENVTPPAAKTPAPVLAVSAEPAFVDPHAASSPGASPEPVRTPKPSPAFTRARPAVQRKVLPAAALALAALALGLFLGKGTAATAAPSTMADQLRNPEGFVGPVTLPSEPDGPAPATGTALQQKAGQPVAETSAHAPKRTGPRSRTKASADQRRAPVAPVPPADGPAWLQSTSAATAAPAAAASAAAATADARAPASAGSPEAQPRAVLLTGLRLRARLSTGLDSRALDGPVEAMSLASVTDARGQVLPARSRLIGAAQLSANGRFVLRFTAVRTRDGRTFPLLAHAVDLSDGRPSLVPTARRDAEAPAGPDVASTVRSVATSAAGTALAALGGGFAAPAQRVAEELMKGRERPQAASDSPVLTVEAGAVFDVVGEDVR